MAEELVELGARKCPKGKILRRGFTRKDGSRVGPSCVPDTGKAGKTPAAKRTLPKPEPGAMKGWKKDMPASERRGIVSGISRREGCATAIRKLTLLRNLTADRGTKVAAKADADWLRSRGFCKLKSKGK